MTKSKAYQIRQIMELQYKDVQDENNQDEYERLSNLPLMELLRIIKELRDDFSTSFTILK